MVWSPCRPCIYGTICAVRLGRRKIGWSSKSQTHARLCHYSIIFDIWGIWCSKFICPLCNYAWPSSCSMLRSQPLGILNRKRYHPRRKKIECQFLNFIMLQLGRGPVITLNPNHIIIRMALPLRLNLPHWFIHWSKHICIFAWASARFTAKRWLKQILTKVSKRIRT